MTLQRWGVYCRYKMDDFREWMDDFPGYDLNGHATIRGYAPTQLLWALPALVTLI